MNPDLVAAYVILDKLDYCLNKGLISLDEFLKEIRILTQNLGTITGEIPRDIRGLN
jgi:hypothetical protein